MIFDDFHFFAIRKMELRNTLILFEVSEYRNRRVPSCLMIFDDFPFLAIEKMELRNSLILFEVLNFANVEFRPVR